MLVVARDEGERIKIGEDTWVVVVKLMKNEVRIGIDAPDGVPIWREELVPPDKRYHRSKLTLP